MEVDTLGNIYARVQVTGGQGIAKIDPAHQLVWVKRLSTGTDRLVYGPDFHLYSANANHILKLDTAGNVLGGWQYGGSYEDVAIYPDGGMVLSDNRGDSVVVLRVDSSGGRLWRQAFDFRIQGNGTHAQTYVAANLQNGGALLATSVPATIQSPPCPTFTYNSNPATLRQWTGTGRPSRAMRPSPLVSTSLWSMT